MEVTYDQIVRGLRDSQYELQNEGRLVNAGLKPEQDTAGIVERYGWLYSDEALDAVGEPAGPEGERVRRALLTGCIERRSAVQQDRLTTHYANATVVVGDERVPFHTAQAQLATEPDPRRREALAQGAQAVMADAEELALAVEATVLEVIRGFGMGGYTEFWASLKKTDYGLLRGEMERVAAATASRYRTWIEPRMVEAGGGWGSCSSAHQSFIRSLGEHDPAYAAGRFEPSMRRTFGALGLELFTAPTIHIDLEDRPAKDPRASVWVPEAGREVHLLVRPSSGVNDYGAFLHEAGHALHFGLADPAIGWPLTNVGSEAYTELWAYLFERMGHDPAWLAEALDLPDARAERIAADQVGIDLALFTRFAGKLANELELYAGDPLDAVRGRVIYQATLSERTGFRYDARPWQFDRYPGHHTADYLRAWLAEAELVRWLRRSFGERWWASRDAGEWLRDQWRHGWTPDVEDVLAGIGGSRRLSGDALLERWAATGAPE
jgi:hypothetical protein